VPEDGATVVIERVYIDNFRCYSGFELRLDRVNLLLGPNGSGKSSLMEALATLADGMGAGTTTNSGFVPDDLTRWDARAEQRFELDVRLDEARFHYRLRLQQDIESYATTIVEEAVEREGRALFTYREGHVHLYRDDDDHVTSFPFADHRSYLLDLDDRPQHAQLARFLGYMRSVRALKLIPSQIESVTVEEHATLRRTGNDFPSWYRHLAQERPGELHGLFEELRRALPGFRSLALVGARRNGRVRDLVARFDSPGGGEHELEFAALSDGQRALIVLYTLLVELRSGPRLLLLDEPEGFVGLTEIRPWLYALEEALENGGQLLLVSQHPEIIDVLAAERPLMFERIDGGPVRVRTSIFQRDGGLQASEQLLRGLEP
jgi:predicted ATPase